MSGYDKIPDEFREYVGFNGNKYFVKMEYLDGRTIFGRFNSIKEACAAACILYRNNWRLMDVVADPLVKYGGEFWVFKIEENKLVLDDKFDDYEKAVEYMEINSRCNDYHNDIFKGSLKKNGYKDRWKSIKFDDVSDIDDECIFKHDEKFFVTKSKRFQQVFGEFNSFDEASAAKKLLVDNKWDISDGNEIVFYKNYYWVFYVDYQILTFKGKSQSYEDALDMFDSEKSKKDSEESYLKSVDDNLERIIALNKKRKKELSKKRNASKVNVRKRKVDITRIWNPSYKNKFEYKLQFSISVEKCHGTNGKGFIMDFNIFNRTIKCNVNGKEIDWKKRYNLDIPGFPEFQLIINILETYGWDFLKIKEASSIHYYNSYYYKVQLVGNSFIFDRFESCSAAEKTHLKYKKVARKNLNPICPNDIVKVGKYYHLVKFQHGDVYKIDELVSLEKIKAVRDILILSNWDFNIFNKYDLFYLNGIYWEITRRFNVIKLVKIFEVINVDMK